MLQPGSYVVNFTNMFDSIRWYHGQKMNGFENIMSQLANYVTNYEVVKRDVQFFPQNN